VFVALGLGILGVAVFFAYSAEFGGSLYGLAALNARKKRLSQSLEEAKAHLAALQSLDAAYRTAIRSFTDELRYAFRRGQEEKEGKKEKAQKEEKEKKEERQKTQEREAK